jgi:hypothetical protein
METKFYIAGTTSSPEIDFNVEEKKFIVRGRSMPNDAESFFNPILTWLRDNLKHQFLKANIDVTLDYYNTGSFIRLMSMFNLLEELNGFDNELTIRWICESDDDDNIADGESFKDVLKIPFEIIEL